MTAISYIYPKGRVEVHGYYWSANQLSESERIQRVFELWRPNVTAVYTHSLGYFMLYKSPVFTSVREAPAAVLIADGDALSNVFGCISSPQGDGGIKINLIHNGELIRINLQPKDTVNVSSWLDVQDIVPEFLSPLVVGPKPPSLLILNTKESVTEIVGKQELAASQSQQQVLQRLKGLADKPLSSADRAGQNKFGLLFKTLASMLRTKKQVQSGASTYGADAPSKSFFRRLKDAFANRVMTSKLGSIIGRGQARYLQEMLDKFSSDDLTDALKHAIPLNDLNNAFQERLSHSMNSLGPRSDLSIRPYGAASGSVVNLEQEFLNLLRTTYERSFVKLDAAQKIAEAAFVLAELLKDITRAVSYLEQHKMYVMAAELAEGQKLPAPRIIRQWVVAGDFDRAMHIAIISGCYEEAITLLERTHAPQAQQLRWRCAQLHVESGNFLLAAEIAWPLLEKRELVFDWMRRHVDLGGEIAARQLVRLLNEDKENTQRYLTKVQALLEDRTANAAASRLSLIEELCHLSATVENKTVAALACRSYLIDVSSGCAFYDAKLWHKLNTLSANQVLRADTRNLKIANVKPRHKLTDTATPLNLAIPSGQGRSIIDCALLENGDIFVAYGEAGAELWSQQGKKLKSFATVCHEVIPADHGNRLILISHRGAVQQLHLYDHTSGKVTFWCDGAFSHWAGSFDGVKWVVAKNASIWVLNAKAEDGAKALWAINDLPGNVMSIKRSPQFFSFCLGCEKGEEVWTYRLPDLFLQERNPLEKKQLQSIIPLTYSPAGLILGVYPSDNQKITFFKQETSLRWSDCAPNLTRSILGLSDDFLVALDEATEGNLALYLYQLLPAQLGKLLLVITAPGCRKINFKRQNTSLIIYTDLGSVCQYNLTWSENQKIIQLN